jgi:hypothetical protein
VTNLLGIFIHCISVQTCNFRNCCRINIHRKQLQEMPKLLLTYVCTFFVSVSYWHDLV